MVQRLWDDFAALGPLSPHAVDVDAEDPQAAADLLAARIRDGSLQLDSPLGGGSTVAVMEGEGDRYRIGELARLSGLSVKTIRSYSDQCLVPPADRTGAGYRVYAARRPWRRS